MNFPDARISLITHVEMRLKVFGYFGNLLYYFYSDKASSFPNTGLDAWLFNVSEKKNCILLNMG